MRPDQLIRQLKKDILDRKINIELFYRLQKRSLARRIQIVNTAPISRKTKKVLLPLLARKDEADYVISRILSWWQKWTRFKKGICPMCGGRLITDTITKRKICSNCGLVF